jgi:hypothetical protein
MFSKCGNGSSEAKTFGSTLVGVLAERHVREIQEPLRFQAEHRVGRHLVEELREALNRFLGALA